MFFGPNKVHFARKYKMDRDCTTVREKGERLIVQEIVRSLLVPQCLVDGFGNDSAFVNIGHDIKGGDQLLVINTDRSGLNIAYKLGLADGQCVGDLGVSHAISDIAASGGIPKCISVALLLPPETKRHFVLEVMKGAEAAATRYGTAIVCGDTKQNPKFAMVVTAVGTVARSNRLTRSGAKPGDLMVVTGYLGTMLLGTIAYRRQQDVQDTIRSILKEAMIHQNPPFQLGRTLAEARVASACMDISDGLSGAVHAMCSASRVGATIDESLIPIKPELIALADKLGFGRLPLSLAGGDWQFLYAIPRENIGRAMDIASELGGCLSIIGEFQHDPSRILAKTLDGDLRRFLRFEHDSFADSSEQGYFDLLGEPRICLGDIASE